MGAQQKNTWSPVYELRNVTGLSQPKLAKLIGSSSGTIYFIESGRVGVTKDVLEKIRLAIGAVWDGQRWTIDPAIEPLLGRKGPIPYDQFAFKLVVELREFPISERDQKKDKRRMLSEFMELCDAIPPAKWLKARQLFALFKETLKAA